MNIKSNIFIKRYKNMTNTFKIKQEKYGLSDWNMNIFSFQNLHVLFTSSSEIK